MKKNHYKKILFFLLLFFTWTPAYAVIITPNNLGLVAYWNLNEGGGTVAHDTGGNKHDGTLTSISNPATATSGWTTLGKLGGAITFDGSDDNVVTPAFTMGFTSDTITFSAWIQNSDPTFAINSRHTIFATTNANTGGGWSIEEDNLNGNGTLYVIAPGQFIASTVGGAIPDNKWHFVTYVRNGTGASSSFYVDGVAQSLGSNGTQDFNDLNEPKTIGDRPNGGATQVWDGKIDEVRVYRRALGAAEVLSLYKAGATTYQTSSVQLTNGSTLGSGSGLVGLWTMDGKDTNWATGVETDRSGQGNNGQFAGGIATTSAAQGKIGQAINFAGAGQTMGATVTGTIGDFTLSMWQKATTYDGTYIQSYAFNTNGFYSYAAGQLRAPGDTIFGCPASSGFFGSVNISTFIGKWAHVVFVRSGTTLSGYINGVLIGSCTTGSGTVSNPNIRIGNILGTRDLNGLADDFRVYNRALSAAEVKALYLAGNTVANASSAALTNGSTLSAGPPANGLVGYWSMDGKDMVGGVMDRSGNGLNGLPVNMSTSTEFAPGKIGQALNFNSALSQKVVLPDIDNSITNQLTVAAWIYPKNAGGNYGGIVGTATAGGFMTFTQFNTLRCDTVTNNGRVFTAWGTIVDNQWQHIVMTYNGAAMTCYINGVQVGSSAQTGTINQQSGGLIGYSASGSEYFNGRIDDVRIYNRTLSASEIKALYNVGR